jgi:methylmalonyl-CoA mutase cobalamin-binding domain/chain
MAERSKPWVMRTYSGHSSAVKSNELYRSNLAKGQTGLSIAFDLPTQTGYDPDAPASAGEVGKVGVPVAHLGHMRQLLDQIPLDEMNTSMTINATAAWLWGLYLALADERGVDFTKLSGTTQNDIVKEYLSRGTYIFAPEPSKRLIVDMIAYAINHVPAWNPINVCSYHLQEAGATPVQEIAYALATAIDVLDAVRDSGKVEPGQMPSVVGRISFFVNGGVRFIEEIAKLRALTAMWDEICRTRYHVDDPSLRRFRYGVQVNSLGLTEQQPENNVSRIVLEMLGVTLSADARARSIQLPAWNEALGLPRPWDQQWSLRMQQVLAFESDLLEYPDIFAGSLVMAAKVRELSAAAQDELDEVLALGGAFAAIDELKGRLVASQAQRVARIESGEQVVVGVNRFTETAESPLTSDVSLDAVMSVDPAFERATSRRCAPLSRSSRGSRRAPRRTTTSWCPPSPWPRPAGRPVSGPTRCAPCSASTARPPACAPGRRNAANSSAPSSSARAPSRPGAARRRGSSSPSPVSTATPTAPSRSPSPRATPVSRWSTRGSGSHRRRSSERRATRTSTSWASRSSRARTWRWCRACSRACATPASAPRSSWGASCPRPTPSPCAPPGWRPSTRPRTSPSRRS